VKSGVACRLGISQNVIERDTLWAKVCTTPVSPNFSLESYALRESNDNCKL